MIFYKKEGIFFWEFSTLFPTRISNNKAWNWSIGFLEIVNISKFPHIFESSHSVFYIQSCPVSFIYKFSC
jgi:hypothetical protein